jgi:hypothetical protein
MTTYHYAKSWFRYDKRPTELWDAARRQAGPRGRQEVTEWWDTAHP